MFSLNKLNTEPQMNIKIKQLLFKIGTVYLL